MNCEHKKLKWYFNEATKAEEWTCLECGERLKPDINGIGELVLRSHGMSRAKGWYDPPNDTRNIPEMLALIHSEVSEALEDYRNGHMAMAFAENGKPIGFPSEIADIVIRVSDLCGYLGIDLAEAVRVKHAFNATRPHRHGGKKC